MKLFSGCLGLVLPVLALASGVASADVCSPGDDVLTSHRTATKAAENVVGGVQRIVSLVDSDGSDRELCYSVKILTDDMEVVNTDSAVRVRYHHFLDPGYGYDSKEQKAAIARVLRFYGAQSYCVSSVTPRPTDPKYGDRASLKAHLESLVPMVQHLLDCRIK